jgi:hypothetical protein
MSTITDSIIDALLQDDFAHAKQDLCFSITGGFNVGGLRTTSWDWYVTYLQECSARNWADIICPVLEGTGKASDSTSLAAKVLLFRVMTQITHILRDKSEASISAIVSNLEALALIKPDVRPLAVQMVFHMIGRMTGLWDSAAEPSAKCLSLRQWYRRPRRRALAHKPVIRALSVEWGNADLPLRELLARFGSLIPMPEIALRDEISGGIESGPECVNTAFISIGNLQKITNFRIEWTYTLAQHLEFETFHRVLRIFHYPSICLLAYRDREGEVPTISRLFHEQLDAEYGKSYKLLEPWQDCIDIEGFLVEVLLSYRLIFGHDRRSRTAAIHALKNMEMKGFGLADPLLEILCTKAASSPEIQDLHRELKTRELEDIVSLDEFPFLGRRLIDLQRFSMTYGPHSLMRLWHDKHNISKWFIVRAVIIFGGLTLIIQILQVIFQIHQRY